MCFVQDYFLSLCLTYSKLALSQDRWTLGVGQGSRGGSSCEISQKKEKDK